MYRQKTWVQIPKEMTHPKMAVRERRVGWIPLPIIQTPAPTMLGTKNVIILAATTRRVFIELPSYQMVECLSLEPHR